MPNNIQSETASILVVDRHEALDETLARYLRGKGYRVVTSATAAAAFDHILRERFDLVLVDVCTPEEKGLELLEKIVARGWGEEVIALTTLDSAEQSASAPCGGAAAYIMKPFDLPQAARTIDQVLAQRRAQPRVEAGSPSTNNHHSNGCAQSAGSRAVKTALIGRAPAMQRLFSIIERVAATDTSVLITGSTGTGKELVARAIHEQSARRNGPFIDINCSAIPDTLIEAELFGHQRGTFTGAHETRRGLLEEASGGTLFLDEINSLNLAAQAKLLRVLQERCLRRVGGRQKIPIDVRIISAANRDLQQAVAEGTFRADLLFRLRVVPLNVPDLCDRGSEDIRLLVEHFLRLHAERCATHPRRFTPAAMRVLTSYRWPGNVRELENAVEYALAIGRGEELDVDDLPPDLFRREASEGHLLEECVRRGAPLEEVERQYIMLMLERHRGNQIKTATALGIDRRTLYRKLKQYGGKSRIEGPGALASLYGGDIPRDRMPGVYSDEIAISETM
jgi:DNA-binding NtrC family response regulator